MKKRTHMGARIMASIALVAILIWILGTGILVVISSQANAPAQEEISSEQLQELLNASWPGTDIISEDIEW